MDNTLDQTTLATISLLEARLLRIERILYGPCTPPAHPPAESAITSLAQLERRFNRLIRHYRVYAEILKIYNPHPSLFQRPSASASEEPPTLLPPAAVRATVLAYATSFPSTASALTAATADTPIPDASQSVALVALAPRMRAIEAVQRAQAAEIAELRARSERAVRGWAQDMSVDYDFRRCGSTVSEPFVGTGNFGKLWTFIRGRDSARYHRNSTPASGKGWHSNKLAGAAEAMMGPYQRSVGFRLGEQMADPTPRPASSAACGDCS
ncbi:hypothetical protein BT67DRAFT_434963 [Trichocladium antarcticum]|uniref:Uncharacterized protein n=1 Tax=Trichocladium antarcticum TaxID=1450529 RepID=A0AAN6ZD98_9PEZI|nr:hypothetical protein BT67DRAFT_434963 [Trichocladium antarcticum]